MPRGDAPIGRNGRRLPFPLVACTVAGVLAAGCGDAGGNAGTEPRAKPAAARPAAPSGAEAVVRGWADDLRRGDIDAAAARFAVPVVVSNNSPEVRLTTRKDVRFFNASLPCGGRVTKIVEHHGILLATLVLTDRPGGACGDGVGGTVQTAFEIRRGRIVRWLRMPDAGAAPPPAGSSDA